MDYDLDKYKIKNSTRHHYIPQLLIVDYKSDEQAKDEFKKFVRMQIKKRPPIPNSCFEFGGVNNIKDIKGTNAKEN